MLAPDPLAFSKLRIFEWDNYPFDLNKFIEKPYVYGIEGAWDSQFLIDLLNYLKESIKKEQGTELIRFWAGVYNQELKKRHITIETLELQHLKSFSEEQHLRIIFE